MKVRMAQEKDIPQINSLLYQVERVHQQGRPDLFKEGAKKYNDEQLKEMLKDSTRPILAAANDDDVMQGYAFCIFQEHKNDNVLTDIKTLYIDDLCVDENCRGQHVGTLLYEAVKKFAKESGCYNVTLNVWECNSSAMKFYQKVGLVPYKTGMEIIL
ncbi:GNAT family N-acetyltransferase [uncultured Ruminococcus sp.]|uniref:GNAT family N-acetyltransferase n=1 Tax=uncultured Ruminococcus sp. TaxID=165186 RepID=UPI0025E019D0|nr:GNAT family N-acetyltransferase [uncultured Ruminococcus sp.]